MDKISNRNLEALFNDLSSALDLTRFASSNDMIRFLTKIRAYDTFYEIYQQVKRENRVVYAGVEESLKEDAFLILLDLAYSQNSKLQFYSLLIEIFQEYEDWANEKIFMKNIIKDLELLPEFEENKQMFDGIGTYEKKTVSKEQSNIKSNQKIDVKSNNKVFIVHGHDNEMKETVARLLEKLDLKPIILHEQPNKGKTVIEKFEKCSEDVGYAVVLLSPDDVGNVKTEQGKLNPRARQNVIFELGYFIAKLGRSRVCALYKEHVEILSDISGVLYTKFDGNGWKLDLANELIEAGYKIDKNKL